MSGRDRTNPNALMVNDADYKWPINPSHLGTKWAIEAHRDGDRCPVSIHPKGGRHA